MTSRSIKLIKFFVSYVEKVHYNSEVNCTVVVLLRCIVVSCMQCLLGALYSGTDRDSAFTIDVTYAYSSMQFCSSYSNES